MSRTPLSCFFAFALVFCAAAKAGLLFTGPAGGSGSGIGTANVILTIQNNSGTESGCVGWDGSADVIGASACPSLSPAVSGGNEKNGSSQTQTRTILTTGVTSAAHLVVLLNVNEPGGNGIDINNVSLTIYSPAGTVLFNSGNLASNPISLPNSQQGQGNLGYAFVLSAADAAAAQPFFANTSNRFGLAALLSNISGSNETFSIADATAAGVTPEPSTLAMVGGLLVFVGLVRRKV